MIYNASNNNVPDDIEFTIGDIVIANNNSVYSSLIGTVKEIRTDKDKETDNEGIDIYCDFSDIADEYKDSIVKALREKTKNTNYNTFDDLALDTVIMSQDMLLKVDKMVNN